MASSGNICVGELEVRPHEHAVLVRGREVPLSSQEFDIVMMLAEHPGWVLSADQLSRDSEQNGCSPESVSVLVSRVRQKLGEVGESALVETVRGAGYRLKAPVSTADDLAEQASRALRDAFWRLQEAVVDLDNSGSLDQKRELADELEHMRRQAYMRLAE